MTLSPIHFVGCLLFGKILPLMSYYSNMLELQWPMIIFCAFFYSA